MNYSLKYGIIGKNVQSLVFYGYIVIFTLLHTFASTIFVPAYAASQTQACFQPTALNIRGISDINFSILKFTNKKDDVFGIYGIIQAIV